MKKLALLLVFAMLIALFPTEVWAADAEYYPACSPSQTSLVDGLTEVGCSDTSFGNRAKIAQINGIASEESYAGSVEQNQAMLSLLKEGKLLKTQESTSGSVESAEGVAGPVASTMASNQSYDIMTTVERAYLRAEPTKKSKTVTVIPEGTLVYVLGKEANDVGNVWYSVQYFDKVLYCFADRLVPHTHDYQIQPLNGGAELSLCECGAVRTSAATGTAVLEATTVYAMIEIAVAVLCTVVVSRHPNAVSDAAGALIYGADEVLEAAGSYGLRMVGDLIIPIRINLAGVAVSVTAKEFDDYMQEQDSNESHDKKYYPAAVLHNAKGDDSVMFFSKKAAMTLDEACDYIDNTLALQGAFTRKYFKFADNGNKFCNVYTVSKDDAEELCEQVVKCKKNLIAEWGRSTIKDNGAGLHECEQNSEARVLGTYEHFHLHQKVGANYVKACSHIFYGDPIMTLTQKNCA